MTVDELIKVLSGFDGNLQVACYSRNGECDFAIDEIRESNTDEFGINDCYCQSDSEFRNVGKVVAIIGGYR